MELTSAIASTNWLKLGYAFFILGAAFLLWRMPWFWLRQPKVFHRFLIVCLAIFAIWQVRAELLDGPAVHLLGATLLTLGFGWQIAALGLVAIAAASTAVNGGDWGAFGINASLVVMIGVGVSYAIARLNERFMPRHLFTYIFVAGFFGAGITIGFVSLGAVAVIYFSQMVDQWAVTKNYLPSSVLLLFPEAFITGALVTLAAVYRAEWLVSYDEERSLRLLENQRDGEKRH